MAIVKSEHKADVEAVIITYGINIKRLRRCIDTLVAQSGELNVSILCIVNSPYFNPRLKKIKEARFEFTGINLGYPGGLNFARQYVNSDFMWIIHDDMELSPNCLDELHGKFEDADKLAMVTPVAVSELGEVLPGSCGGILHTTGWMDRSLPETPTKPEELVNLNKLSYLSSKGMMIRTSAWDDVNGVDARFYPSQWMDVDLCMALKWRKWYFKTVTTAIFESKQTGAAPSILNQFLSARNSELFIAKWFSPKVRKTTAQTVESSEEVEKQQSTTQIKSEEKDKEIKDVGGNAKAEKIESVDVHIERSEEADSDKQNKVGQVHAEGENKEGASKDGQSHPVDNGYNNEEKGQSEKIRETEKVECDISVEDVGSEEVEKKAENNEEQVKRDEEKLSGTSNKENTKGDTDEDEDEEEGEADQDEKEAQMSFFRPYAPTCLTGKVNPNISDGLFSTVAQVASDTLLHLLHVYSLYIRKSSKEKQDLLQYCMKSQQEIIKLKGEHSLIIQYEKDEKGRLKNYLERWKKGYRDLQSQYTHVTQVAKKESTKRKELDQELVNIQSSHKSDFEKVKRMFKVVQEDRVKLIKSLSEETEARESLEKKIEKMQSNLTWRMTKPLRSIASIFKKN